jgi:hypothetical protein
LYESLFDLKKPWGVVALGTFVSAFTEISMGGLVQIFTRTPLILIASSYIVGILMSFIPVKGAKRLNMSGVQNPEALGPLF